VNKSEIAANCEEYLEFVNKIEVAEQALWILKDRLSKIGRKFCELEAPEFFSYYDGVNAWSFTLDIDDFTGVVELQKFQEFFEEKIVQ
jgi:ferredoxin